MNYALEISNIYKGYDKAVLKDFSVKIEENKIYALLGRNGVGKTTLINIIKNKVRPDKGEIKIFGNGEFDNIESLSKIVAVGEPLTLLANMKVKEIFKLAKSFYKNWDENFKETLVESFELDIKKKYGKLSKGQQSMVSMIMGLASRAEITIFDEVYSGLDAVARDMFYKILLEDYIENPRTIIYSTHLIEEAKNLFQEVIILSEGKVILQEDIDILKEKSIEIVGKEEKIVEIIDGINVLSKELVCNKMVAYIYDELSEEKRKLIKELGVQVRGISLQELFVKLTSK